MPGTVETFAQWNAGRRNAEVALVGMSWKEATNLFHRIFWEAIHNIQI